MEEKSLSLVEKSQHTSEVLDRIHSTTITTQTEQDHQVEQLQLKINHLKDLINHEIEREMTCKNLFTYYLTSDYHLTLSIIFSILVNIGPRKTIRSMIS